MSAFTFPSPRPSPGAEALRQEVRAFLRSEIADRPGVGRYCAGLSRAGLASDNRGVSDKQAVSDNRGAAVNQEKRT